MSQLVIDTEIITVEIVEAQLQKQNLEKNSVTEIMILDSVKGIEICAFRNFQNLTSIKIPSGVETIGDAAFENCRSLTNVPIPSGVETIGVATFQDCFSLTDVHIPSGVKTIGVNAFRGCTSLTDVHIPSGVKTIGAAAFQNCRSLTEVHICEGVEVIEVRAFNGCDRLTSITLPKSLRELEAGAFEDCDELAAIELPEGLTQIGAVAFRGCERLMTIKIPQSVTEVGKSIFIGCTNLEMIYLPEQLVDAYVSHYWTDKDSVTFVPQNDIYNFAKSRGLSGTNFDGLLALYRFSEEILTPEHLSNTIRQIAYGDIIKMVPQLLLKIPCRALGIKQPDTAACANSLLGGQGIPLQELTQITFGNIGVFAKLPEALLDFLGIKDLYNIIKAYNPNSVSSRDVKDIVSTGGGGPRALTQPSSSLKPDQVPDETVQRSSDQDMPPQTETDPSDISHAQKR